MVVYAGRIDAIVRPSPLALAVLGLLAGGPLHPYRMQRLIKEWGKDQVVNVGQRANLYKTIKRLNEAGLVAVHQTERDPGYPERTVYGLTDAGRATVDAWLVDLVSTPRNEFPQFPAALSFVMLLGPDGARVALERRAVLLQQGLAGLDRDLESAGPGLPRVTLLETEYQRAVMAAELAWVENIIADLRTGALGWSEADFASAAAESYQLE
jgi:DNA-binding PadR family transcriptional regulator